MTEAGVFKLGFGTPEGVRRFCENLKGGKINNKCFFFVFFRGLKVCISVNYMLINHFKYVFNEYVYFFKDVRLITIILF